jgi:hypothetical protein
MLMGITIEEEQINQQLSKVKINQEVNRKQQWRLEELEQDYQRLSMQHEAFLSTILQTAENEEMRYYFLSEEDEVKARALYIIAIELAKDLGGRISEGSIDRWQTINVLKKSMKRFCI